MAFTCAHTLYVCALCQQPLLPGATAAALAMEGAPTIQENIMRVLRDHYWDSLEPQKALILKHIEGAMRWHRP